MLAKQIIFENSNINMFLCSKLLFSSKASTIALICQFEFVMCSNMSAAAAIQMLMFLGVNFQYIFWKKKNPGHWTLVEACKSNTDLLHNYILILDKSC